MPTFKIKQNGSWVYVSPPGYSNKEDKANKVTSWQATTDNDHYPTEKLVKDSLDNKQNAITQSASAPTNPSVGDYWDDTNDVVYSTTGQTTVVVDQAIIDGSVNPVSGNAVHDALVTLDTKLTSKSATASDVGKFAKVKTVDTATGTVSEWEFGIGGSGDGSSDFDVLTNRPQYNGTVMTHSTNIPQVKTTTWDAKYDKPSEGIPKTDLASGVQTSLDKADSALQQQSLSTYRTWAAQDVIDNGKVDKVTGKGLSTEDYTTAEKTKLSGIEPGAEINVQSDWSQSDDTADDYIKNKPTALSDFIDDLDNSPLHTHPQYLTAQSSAISQHTSQITATQGMISDAWNNSTAYTVGQYCIDNNALYRCKVQHSGQRPPNATYWEAVSVCDELGMYGKGQYSLQGIFSGHITGGGGFVAFFVPLTVSKNVSGYAISLTSPKIFIYTPDSVYFETDLTSDASQHKIYKKANGFIIELGFASTKAINKVANVRIEQGLNINLS